MYEYSKKKKKIPVEILFWTLHALSNMTLQNFLFVVDTTISGEISLCWRWRLRRIYHKAVAWEQSFVGFAWLCCIVCDPVTFLCKLIFYDEKEYQTECAIRVR